MKNRLKQELEKEISYLEDYRKQTAKFSLTVLEQVEDIYVFINMDSSFKTVERLLDEDYYRLQDVAKMLNVLLRNLMLEDSLSDEMKQELAKRKGRRKEKPFLE